MAHKFKSTKITTCNRYHKDDTLPLAYLMSPIVKEDLCATCFYARHSVDADGVTVSPCKLSERKAANRGKNI